MSTEKYSLHCSTLLSDPQSHLYSEHWWVLQTAKGTTSNPLEKYISNCELKTMCGTTVLCVYMSLVWLARPSLLVPYGRENVEHT